MLAQKQNLDGLAAINRELIARAESIESTQPVMLDMDSTEIPVYGQQENSAYNGQFESACYHPRLLFNCEGYRMGGQAMSAARFRFYAELNDFLPEENRGKELTRYFSVSGSVKDFVESFGVPHTEVDLVLANGRPVDFFYQVGGGDRVSVYPVFESLDISSVSRVRLAPLGALRFLLDVHVGRLAAYLRMAGFDALYSNQASDPELAAIVSREGRVLLTRDRYLLMRTAVDRGYWVRSTEPKQQLLEVVKRFDLAGSMRPFTRCLDCNTILEEASRESVLERLPPKIMDEVFRVCPSCQRVYWEGTHHERMSKLLRWVKANVPVSPME